jgi:acetyl coenzyme A synthetase (ADP forming)-like protein
MRRFFARLSPESLRQRFFGLHQPAPDLLKRLCDSGDPQEALTLVAVRTIGGASEFVGVGSYMRTGEGTAEVAFAVDDAYHGKGIATSLLEYLVVEAGRRGFERFRATTLQDNVAMQDVFRQSGFEVRAGPKGGVVDVELAIAPTAAGVSASEERERQATVASIRPLLQPRSIAVVGVSRQSQSVGRRVFEAIRDAGFTGRLFPVNPQAQEIGGVPAFPRVADIRAPIDLAVIAVPSGAVLPVVDECAAAGVRALVIVTAGFAESGEEGRARQQALVDKVRGYGMRMVGPNCLGVMNTSPDIRLNATFAPIFPPAGRLAILSQSGAIGIVVISLGARRHVGISSFVSVGNKADVSGNDLLEFWESDPATSVIAFYLESFGNPRRFQRLARRVARTKPVVVVKAGRSAAGSRAAGSHTASMAASDTAVDALFEQTGVIRTGTIDELFDVAACLEAQPLPSGRNVAIVTNAGGPGILAADACTAEGLAVAEFSAKTRDRLRALVSHMGTVANPVDLIATAGASEYQHVVEAVLASDDVDALMVQYTSVNASMTQAVVTGIERGVVAARAAGCASKPVVLCLMGTTVDAPVVAGSERIPVYAFPENAARALGKVAGYAAWRRLPPGRHWRFDDLDSAGAREICRGAAQARGTDWLTTEETERVLESVGIFPVPTVLTRSAEDAVSVAGAMGYPVVAKLGSGDLVHKTEAGGVVSHLSTGDAVRSAFDALARRAKGQHLRFDGVYLQPMIGGGIETMVGVVRDRLFGPLIGFGLGGTEVEVLADVRFRVAPLTDRDVAELVASTRASKLLSGYRGRPPADRNALTALLSRVSALVEDVPEILELDLNPVIVMPDGQGCRIVDARIRVGPSPDTHRQTDVVTRTP